MRKKKKKLPIFYTCELPDIKIKEFYKSQIADVQKYSKDFLMRYKPFFECDCRHPNDVVIIKKRINQRKYKLHCPDCKETKTLVIPEGYEVCLHCNGTGGIFIGEGNIKNFDVGLKNYVQKCNNCNGKGLTSWIDKILR